MVPEHVAREILIDAPVEVVWAVVTEPEHLGRWLGDTAAIDLRPGGALRLTYGEHGVIRGRVERVEPPHFVSFHWAFSAREGGAGVEVREGNATLVEFRLTAEGAGTRLRVVESGFARLDGTADENARYAEDHGRGWERELGELRDYVATVRGAARR
ncbi:MAG TPA: SRPBCC domain-containing protein [Thermomicrobiales bacterium]|nr:SRPBCC domain-containing protein [Thermomicrobiales bacterium]